MTGLIIFVISIAVILLLTVKYRLNAALVIIGVTIITGIFAGPPINEVVSTVRNGFGYTLGYAGILIVEGMVIAVILEKTGILESIADSIFKKAGSEKSVLVMSITGFAVSIPVLCDSGFVALSSVNESLSEKCGKSLAAISVALATGLYVTHCLVPPTPGPVTSMGILNANPYMVTFLGMAVSVPGMLAGYYWAVKYVGRHEFTPVFDIEHGNREPAGVYNGRGFYKYIPILLPVVLMAARQFAMIPSGPIGSGIITRIISFTGDPAAAFFTGIIAAAVIAGKEHSIAELNNWCTEGIRRTAPVLIIVGAGGAYGAVIKASTFTASAVSLMSGWHIGILLPFIIAAVLKTATGSSTVSIITASSVISPMTETLGINPALAVLAIGSGSMLVSHVNDPFFWIVAKFSGMDEKTAFRFFTPATAITGAASFIPVAILSIFIS